MVIKNLIGRFKNQNNSSFNVNFLEKKTNDLVNKYSQVDFPLSGLGLKIGRFTTYDEKENRRRKVMSEQFVDDLMHFSTDEIIDFSENLKGYFNFKSYVYSSLKK